MARPRKPPAPKRTASPHAPAARRAAKKTTPRATPARKRPPRAHVRTNLIDPPSYLDPAVYLDLDASTRYLDILGWSTVPGTPYPRAKLSAQLDRLAHYLKQDELLPCAFTLTLVDVD